MVNWELVTVLAEVWFAIANQAIYIVKGGVLTAWLAELIYNTIKYRAYTILTSIGLVAVGTRIISSISLMIVNAYMPLGLGLWDYYYLALNLAYAGLLLLAGHYRLRFNTREFWDLLYIIALVVWIGIGVYNSALFIYTFITYLLGH